MALLTLDNPARKQYYWDILEQLLTHFQLGTRLIGTLLFQVVHQSSLEPSLASFTVLIFLGTTQTANRVSGTLEYPGTRKLI